MQYLKLPNASSTVAGMSAKEGRRVGGWATYSKEPKVIGLTREADVDALADAAPTTSRFPTDGAN